jgi:RimJ/RimL family protein N-acetyltransferase
MSDFCDIETDRLRLRKLRGSDLEDLCRYRSDPMVSKYQSWSEYTLDQAEDLMNTSSEFNIPGAWFQIAIAEKCSDSIIGDVGIHFLDDDMQVEIGYTVASQHQRQGFAKEALLAIIRYLFVVLGKHRISATLDTLNLSSMKLLESLRFRREAHFVENIFFKGVWGSEYVYSMLASELVD